MTTENTSPEKSMKVHCSFINADVLQQDLNEHCDEMIVNGKYTARELSPQIGYGVLPARIIENFTMSKP